MITHQEPRSKLTQADRTLVQALGSRLRLIIQGKDAEPLDVDRRDELGILANMVNRVGKELRLSRRRDEQQRAELEQRLAELDAAYATQQELLARVKELSTPILSIYQQVLLLPLVGALDTTRTQHVITTLLDEITTRRAHVVILDITGVPVVDTDVASLLLQAARATALLGARVILCGISPGVAQVVVSLGIDLSTLTPCSDLQAALERALQITQHRITKH
jgi:rsbT co-antagonist protein RsbR